MYLDVNPVAPTGMTFLTSFTAISYSRYVPSLSNSSFLLLLSSYNVFPNRKITVPQSRISFFEPHPFYHYPVVRPISVAELLSA